MIAQGRDLEQLLSTNERLASRVAEELPTVRVEAPSRLLPSIAAQSRRAELVKHSGLTPDGVRVSLAAAADAAGFQPRAFDGFAERLSRLLDPSLRVTYDEYVSHGLRDLIGRFVSYSAGEWTIALVRVSPRKPEDRHRVDPGEVVDAVSILRRPRPDSNW